MAYVHGFVGVVDASSDDLAVVYEYTTYRRLVGGEGVLCLWH